MRIDHPHTGQIPALQALWQEAFGDSPAFIHSFFDTAYAPRRCLCITLEDTVVAAAYWLDCKYDDRPAAYIYAVATGKAYRGQGYCRLLMTHIHAHLAALGYAGAILVPGEPTLRTMYRAMGYQDLGGMEEQFAAARGHTPLWEISPEAYGQLRPSYLPLGGVVQEKENLTFLARHYRFYQGTGFILTAQVQNGSLFAPELLGNADPAGILTALDAREGTFRVPGKQPFAMWHPLTAAPAPTYFGFAFD